MKISKLQYNYTDLQHLHSELAIFLFNPYTNAFKNPYHIKKYTCKGDTKLSIYDNISLSGNNLHKNPHIDMKINIIKYHKTLFLIPFPTESDVIFLYIDIHNPTLIKNINNCGP